MKRLSGVLLALAAVTVLWTGTAAGQEPLPATADGSQLQADTAQSPVQSTGEADDRQPLPTWDLTAGVPVVSNVDSRRQPYNVVAGRQQEDRQQDQGRRRRAAVEQQATLVAEKIYINDGNGNVYARGDVRLTQGEVEVKGDRIDGNIQANTVQIDGTASYRDPHGWLEGTAIWYNYDLSTGRIGRFDGHYNNQFIVGEQAEIYPDRLVVRNGYMTRCPAHIPDYRMQADVIEIWPGREIIAYNARWFIKDVEIVSQAVYRAALDEEGGNYPQVGYNDVDGAWIRQAFSAQIGQQPVQFVVAYLTNPGLALQLNSDLPFGGGWRGTVHAGSYEDSQYNWIQKWPEVDIDSPVWQLGDTPVTYSISAVLGWWHQDPRFNRSVSAVTDSFHQYYAIYFNYGRPVPLGWNSSLYFGTGYNVTLESHNHSTIQAYALDASVWTTLSPQVSMLNGYHYTTN
ncbi:MAG: hypothetical protein N3A57_07735, partial [Negativicutes bacterium]|nr:hypothetical protein [Negativicutes bacterium]